MPPDPPPPVEALLFDLDGTLADTAELNTRAYAQALGEFGIAISEENLRAAAHGRHWRQFLPELVAARSVGVDPAQIAARKRAIYPQLTSHVRFNEGLLGLLRSARPTYRTALVTTASHAAVEAIISARGLSTLFDAIVTGDDVAVHKPHPQAYLLAADRLDLDPCRCLVFEDSEPGIASASAAGMRVIVTRMDA